MTRLILAGTLSGNYGIYGPAFELCEGRPVREGSEEYLDSEKYQIRVWDIHDPNSLRDLITHVNRIRKNSRSLQQNLGLAFHPVDNSTADRLQPDDGRQAGHDSSRRESGPAQSAGRLG